MLTYLQTSVQCQSGQLLLKARTGYRRYVTFMPTAPSCQLNHRDGVQDVEVAGGGIPPSSYAKFWGLCEDLCDVADAAGPTVMKWVRPLVQHSVLLSVVHCYYGSFCKIYTLPPAPNNYSHLLGYNLMQLCEFGNIRSRIGSQEPGCTELYT